MRGLKILLPRADIGRDVRRRRTAQAGRRGHRRDRATAPIVAEAGARGRAGHLPHAARAPHRRRHLHERVGGRGVRPACSAPSRRPICCAPPSVASIGPVTAEAASQYNIKTTIMPAVATRFRRWSTRSWSIFERSNHEPDCISATNLVAHPPAAPPAPFGGDARDGARNAPVAGHVHAAAVRLRGRRRAPRSRRRCRASFNLSVDEAVHEAAAARADGVRRRAAVRPAGPQGRRSDRRPYDPRRRCSRPSARSSARRPDMLVVTDVCLCEYTDARPLRHRRRRRDRQRSDGRAAGARRRLARRRPAPTSSRRPDMMDGRVGAIRDALDERGFEQRRRSCPTPRSTARRSTVRSATRPTRRRRSAIAGRTRWIRPTSTRRCARWSRTSRKAPTS